MSDTLTSRSFDFVRATEFNVRQANRLGWYDQIPDAVLELYPSLQFDALGVSEDRRVFAEAVYAYQLDNEQLADDGMLGRGTWLDMLKRHDHVETGEDYVILKERRIALQRSGKLPYQLYAFDQQGGIDLHRGGDFTSWKKLPKRKIWRILWHWGGHSVKSCRNALFNRDLTSHAGIELGAAFLWLDLGHKGWHASWANEGTIAIDICQQPTIGNLERYLAKGLDVRKVINPARRPSGRVLGDKIVLSLDPRTAETVREFTRDLCQVFEIPFDVPRDENGNISHRLMTRSQFRSYEGVLFHSHVSKGKWDVSPWGPQILEPGFEYQNA